MSRNQPLRHMRARALSILGVALLALGCSAPTADMSRAPGGTQADASTPVTTARPSPSPTAQPTATPSTMPIPGPPETGRLVVEGMARVIADDVVVREAPGRQSAFVSQRCITSPAPCGQVLFGQNSGIESVYLLDGPIAADGYDWYLAASDTQYSLFPEYVGWIPAGDSAGPWVIAAPPDCPEEPIELAEVTFAAISLLARLDCVGGTELTLRGWYPAPPPTGVSDETCQPLDGRPMFCQFGYDLLRPVEAPWAGDGNALEFVVESAAGLTQPERGSWITVRGRVDHPASSECYEGDIHAVMSCRLEFVVTGVSSE